MIIFLKVAFVEDLYYWDTMFSDSIHTTTAGSRNYGYLHLVDGETEALGSLSAQSHPAGQ